MTMRIDRHKDGLEALRVFFSTQWGSKTRIDHGMWSETEFTATPSEAYIRPEEDERTCQQVAVNGTQREYIAEGVIYVRLFVPWQTPVATVAELKDDLEGILRGAEIADYGKLFAPKSRRVGRDDAWIMHLTEVPYRRHFWIDKAEP